MAHTMSRAQRHAAFLERVIQMFNALEEWYDEHPDASFGDRSCIASCNRWKVYDYTQDYLALPGVVKSGFVASETKTVHLD